MTHALRPVGPLRIPATIGDSLDGRSVIFVKNDPTASAITSASGRFRGTTTDLMDEPPICPERHAAGGIEALALGGQYVEILTRYGNVQTLISSTFVRCIEKVVTRTRLGADASPAIAGDASTLAYAVRTGRSPTESGAWPGSVRPARPRFLRRQAVGRPRSGRRARCRRPYRRVAGRPRAADVRADRGSGLALRGNELTVITRAGTLDTYALWSGDLLHRWRLPAGTAPAVDVHYGVAVVSAGRQLVAINLSTGRSACC